MTDERDAIREALLTGRPVREALTEHHARPEPDESAIRDRIADAIRKRADEQGTAVFWGDLADAVLPVVEAAIERAEQRYKGIAEGYARELRDLVGKLGQAEASVQRVRELHVRHDCTTHVKASTPVPCVNHGICEGCGAPPGYPCRTLEALDQPEATP
ncbi:hypothetical protein BJF79_13565 [Actinomadura sp. CNU-125]|uniref:hypothetical protein n=1 Tax=Actinomadura sp. CNU-125 TaxID=1904961 RepID=UPI00095F7647|nr:hypothetical protein [Actinomadura sp. CNU-125]OLT24366.1 hypothetical protein BJF79_13565 [Actinomadura sp. CNU-125]